MPTTTAVGTYHVRAEVSTDVQQALMQEQAQRQLKGERISLMALAAEWLEEITEQKRGRTA